MLSNSPVSTKTARGRPMMSPIFVAVVRQLVNQPCGLDRGGRPETFQALQPALMPAGAHHVYANVPGILIINSTTTGSPCHEYLSCRPEPHTLGDHRHGSSNWGLAPLAAWQRRSRPIAAIPTLGPWHPRTAATRWSSGVSTGWVAPFDIWWRRCPDSRSAALASGL